MSAIVTVYATFADADEAATVARTVVEERLAACANLLAPCTSIYRWLGAVEEAQEVPGLFKTRAELAERLIARIAELHSYEVPAAVVWPIDHALPAYVDWVAEEVTSRRKPGFRED